MKQLDLFRDCTMEVAPGVIQPFPIARRTDVLATIMTGLAARNERDGRKFWNASIREIKRQLKQAGVAKADIDKQIRDLTRAVQIEMDYRPHRWGIIGQ
jgi:hypothetical protein